MTIYEYIQKLKELKENFKIKFLEYDVDLEEVPFTDYANYFDFVRPFLLPVEIKRDENYLQVIPNENNGAFVTSYELYNNEEKILSTEENRFNLLELDLGRYNLTVKAVGAHFNDSVISNEIEYGVFSVTTNFSGISGEFINRVGLYETIVGVINVQDEGTYLPREIIVTDGENEAEFVYNNFTGEIIISNVQGNVNIKAEASTLPNLEKPIVEVYYNEISWNTIENATSYKIYSSKEFVCELTTNYVDLSEYLPEGQNYSITVTACADNYQESALSEAVIVEVLNLFPMYGVSGLNDNSSSILTRTHDSKGLNFYFNESSGEVISDFDTCFPYNEMEEAEINGNIMIKIPRMYFKVDVNDSGNITELAVSRYPREEDNWYESEEFYVAKYLSSLNSETLNSKTSSVKLRAHNLATLQKNVSNNGEGFSLSNVKTKTVLGFLFLIEMANKNTNFLLRKDSNTIVAGKSDSVLTSTGFSLEEGNFKYRQIEDFVGSNLEFFDGLKIVGGHYQTNIGQTEYVPLGLQAGEYDWVNGLQWKKEFPFVCVATDLVSDPEGTFYCKGCRQHFNEYYFAHGGTMSQEGSGYFLFAHTTSQNDKYFCTRLIYKEKQ